MSILKRSAADLGRAMAAGELTSEEITRAFLEQIEALNPTLNVFLSVDAESALAQARGDVPAIARHARAVLALAGAEDSFVRGAASGYLGFAAWLAGDVQEALATFTEAVRLLHAAGPSMSMTWGETGWVRRPQWEPWPSARRSSR